MSKQTIDKPLTQKAQKEKDRQEAIEYLRKLLPPGSTVYTVLRSVSRSGMSRQIDVVVMSEYDGKPEPQTVSYRVALACGYTRDYKSGALKVSGCGMDMGFAVVYDLSRKLYPNGFIPAEAGATRGRNGTKATELDSDGGYALSHRWL